MSAPGSQRRAARVAPQFQAATHPRGQRKANPRKRPPPFSLRLTVAERAQLEAEAGTQPLGTYVRSRLFDSKGPTKAKAAVRSIRDQEALAQLLALLGSLRLSNNLNQLAKAANCGALPVDEGVVEELTEACQEIRWMRQTLITALSLKS